MCTVIIATVNKNVEVSWYIIDSGSLGRIAKSIGGTSVSFLRTSMLISVVTSLI